MGVFEMVVYIVAIGVGGGVVTELLKKRGPKKAEIHALETRLAKLEALEERISTLEKIVTNPKQHLSDEIEAL